MNETSDIDYEQVVNLIQSILSLEYCLQYQIIPLTLEQSCLSLGMVNPKDKTALDFVRPIVSTLGYGLTIQQIDTYTHQLALAEYLKNNYSLEQTQANILPQDSSSKVCDSTITNVNTDFEQQKNGQRNNLDDKATVIGGYPENFFDVPVAKVEVSVKDSQPTIYANDQENSPPSDVSSQLIGDPTKLQTSTQNQLEVQDFDIFRPSVNFCLTHQSLSNLSPQQLWQELFMQILDGSISKLNLERQQGFGRIMWGQDGVAQSSLDNVSLSILQALINEIKTVAKIPLEPLQKTKKVAIEKHYQQERLQLRLDACPGQWGDEITIQVLRGNELKLYEQQQIKKMSDQALLLAQKLAKTLTTMVTCFDSSAIGDISELKKVQQEIDRKLELLG